MKNTGDGRRKTRVEKEVQGVISEYIIQQMKNDIPGLVTVTKVQMPADFRAAQVYITYYNPINLDLSKNFDVIDVLQSFATDMQNELAQQLKMRYCPKIKFFYDETTEHIIKIEKILSNLSPNEKMRAIDDNINEDSDEDSH